MKKKKKKRIGQTENFKAIDMDQILNWAIKKYILEDLPI